MPTIHNTPFLYITRCLTTSVALFYRGTSHLQLRYFSARGAVATATEEKYPLDISVAINASPSAFDNFSMMVNHLAQFFTSVPDVLHDYIFSGGILKGGTWGGKECQATISLGSHSIELFIWFLISALIYKLCSYEEIYREMMVKGASVLKDHRRTTASQILDILFATLHFGIWLLVLYYKITLHSLINLCQPCHIALFVQGVGVVVGGPEGAIIGILSLPLVVGPIGALIVPALDGLDQPYEKLFFFIQHYLLLITPLFLLLRNNYCAFKLVTFRSLILANWALLILHWFIFAPVNRHFGVNVNFMLCPSEGMSSAFNQFPPWLLWPSYRTIIVAIFFVFSFPICYTYIGMCKAIIFIIQLFRINDDNTDYSSKMIETLTVNMEDRGNLKKKKII